MGLPGEHGNVQVSASPAALSPQDESAMVADARGIWNAGVAAVAADRLVMAAIAEFPPEWLEALRHAPRILVVGAGKAGAGMAAGWEAAFPELLPRTTGWVNVPQGAQRPLARIHLHAARPAGWNHPTPEGVTGTEAMLQLLAEAGPDDVAICLLSGGGSALMPAPIDGITLEDKQTVTKLLHGSGATIEEMNTVRKHLSRVKGGRLAEAFSGRLLLTLVISDVVGDPLDVIASGPTTPDPTTYADAWAILEQRQLLERIPRRCRDVLDAGRHGRRPETPKSLPPRVQTRIIGNNLTALRAAEQAARERGYAVLNLGPLIEGESREVAIAIAGLCRSIRDLSLPMPPPLCLLLGGETTVTLGDQHGRGGRNLEFVLAAGVKLGEAGLNRLVIVSGGTDGEDGPTDAAGAILTRSVWQTAQRLGLNAAHFLTQHASYDFFAAVGSLLKPGWTGTNVMDLRLVLIR